MANDQVVSPMNENVDINDPDYLILVHKAQEADEADHQLTVKQALHKYKKAVAWATLLSATLIMEGYDLVIVC